MKSRIMLELDDATIMTIKLRAIKKGIKPSQVIDEAIAIIHKDDFEKSKQIIKESNNETKIK